MTQLEPESCCLSSYLCTIWIWQPVKLLIFNSRFLFLARCEVPFSSDLCCLYCHDPSLGCYCQAKSFPGWSPEVWVAAGDCCHEHQQVKEAPLPAQPVCTLQRDPGLMRRPLKVTLGGTAEGYLPRASQPLVTPTGCKTADKTPPKDWKKQIVLSLICTSRHHMGESQETESTDDDHHKLSGFNLILIQLRIYDITENTGKCRAR